MSTLLLVGELDPQIYDPFKRPRCTVCEGAGEATDTEPACAHCGGTGHEPGEAT